MILTEKCLIDFKLWASRQQYICSEEHILLSNDKLADTSICNHIVTFLDTKQIFIIPNVMMSNSDVKHVFYCDIRDCKMRLLAQSENYDSRFLSVFNAIISANDYYNRFNQ